MARGRWRKLKAVASVRLPDGTIRLAEIHWYEAYGIGKKEFKLKSYLSWTSNEEKQNNSFCTLPE